VSSVSTTHVRKYFVPPVPPVALNRTRPPEAVWSEIVRPDGVEVSDVTSTIDSPSSAISFRASKLN
jgi:hypothetical protein